MRTTLHTRKPIDGITSEDLDAFPIWEFATDEEGVEGQDETWIRPVASSIISRKAYSLSVAAKFVTASGRELPGLVGVTTAGSIKLGHAALVPNGKYIFVPSPKFSDAKTEYKNIAASLGMSEPEVFPLRFTLKALIQDETDFRTGEFKL